MELGEKVKAVERGYKTLENLYNALKEMETPTELENVLMTKKEGIGFITFSYHGVNIIFELQAILDKEYPNRYDRFLYCHEEEKQSDCLYKLLNRNGEYISVDVRECNTSDRESAIQFIKEVINLLCDGKSGIPLFNLAPPESHF